MAQQINSKLNQPMTNGEVTQTAANVSQTTHIGATHQHSNESVDLDNLFAFLSEVTPNSNSSTTSTINNTSSIIDDIGEKMDNLVHDLDVELENVLQQEMEGLSLDQQPSSKTSAGKMGVPTLPEPTTRPPPPPTSNTNTKSTNGMAKVNATANLNDLSKSVPMTKPPTAPETNTVTKTKRLEEPIYEAVIPRQELPVVLEMPEPIIHNHENHHKLRYQIIKLKSINS